MEVKEEVSLNNGEFRDRLGRYIKGAPGKPFGAINHKTRLTNHLLSLVGRPEMRRLKHRLKSSNSQEFMETLSLIIKVLLGNDGKALIDQSQKTTLIFSVNGKENQD